MHEDRALFTASLDSTIAQTIHARYRYTLDDIVHNARFADVLTVLQDGTRQLDYRHFHEVVPIDSAMGSGAAC
jgi:inward rectifier potassium channel